MCEIPDPGGTSIDDLFDIIEEIGKGGYGSVYKAREKETGSIYALKKINKFDDRQATPPSFFRETECLHEIAKSDAKGANNILKLHKIIRCHQNNCFFLVLEMCDCDLGDIIKLYSSCEDDFDEHQTPNQICPNLSFDQIKNYMVQILQGMTTLHDHGFVHRDIKPPNILIKNGTDIKICDFGLTRNLSKNRSRFCRPLTPHVATPSYRAPELLLGSTKYDQSIDVWSVGCLLFEMATGKVLFHSRNSQSDFAQLNTIFRICGTPHLDDSSLHHLPNAMLISSMPNYEPILEEVLDSTLPSFFEPMKQVLIEMLQLDPQKRISLKDALLDPFFSGETEKIIERNQTFIKSGTFFNENRFIEDKIFPSKLENNENNIQIKNRATPRNIIDKLRPTKVTPPEISIF
ncbi:Cyclin-dependent kinase 2 [Tritrichomonas foetus]|uniref:Cyclin-dependent kinase 2 n=1 Tax=Tritrichomonas foetus TaxID=1144522 RepID=A0A1J4JXW0_9EUKA|nr:Cyclin-dependent kinase 2 [Tritrichomonas foetus]|eukprot:OHT03288.1 Cyclin-dependent kinase 2 [Tritrichomonas foetus]